MPSVAVLPPRAALGADAFLREKFACPISGEVMGRPVVALDGITYDQSAIETWLRNCPGQPSSPVTRAPMEPRLVTAYLVRELMEAHATCRSALLPPTHGVIRVPRGQVTQSDQGHAMRTHTLRSRSIPEWMVVARYFLVTTAVGTLTTVFLAKGAIAAGWDSQRQYFAQYGALLGPCGAMIGCVAGRERQVLGTLSAAAGASLMGVSSAALAAVVEPDDPVWRGFNMCPTGSRCAFSAYHVWGTGIAGAVAGAAVGYRAGCLLGASVCRRLGPGQAEAP